MIKRNKEARKRAEKVGEDFNPIRNGGEKQDKQAKQKRMANKLKYRKSVLWRPKDFSKWDREEKLKLYLHEKMS